MKSPLGKLRRFALHAKNDAKDKREFSPSAQIDELAQAAQDMQEMRDCYDSLLSAAAATANSAYEFSESLREMGSFLMEKTTLHEDEESYKLLSMLGKTQFELQKLVDSYRSHIFMTITNPSESLLNELRTVEDMKRQCDEKRTVYEHMMSQLKEKGRSKSGKGESFTQQQLQTAHDEYDEDATLCVFRLKSLKQGQSRSLLTQAARHHAAQLNFFRKGLKSLEVVDPHVRLVTQEQHIDYPFSGLENDGGDDGETDFENSYSTNDDGELIFHSKANKQGVDAVSTFKNSVEVADSSFPRDSAMEDAEVNIDNTQGDHKVIGKEGRVGSHSAPIFQERKSEHFESIKQIPSSRRKSNSYVLPTPLDAKGVIPSRTIPQAKPSNMSVQTSNLWHSSPLEQRKHEKDSNNDGYLSVLTALKTNLTQKESNTNKSSQLPLPSKERISLPQLDTFNLSDTKKMKRQASSGQLSSKPSSAGVSSDTPQLVSGVISHVTVPQPSSSPKLSPSASPPPASPRINELHELPRPPSNSGSKAAKSQGFTGHSAPLFYRNSEVSVSLSNKSLSATSNAASPLPTPPLAAFRSFSVRSSNQRAMAIHVSNPLESPQVPEKAEEFESPPLTPISLISVKPISTITELVSQSGQIRGGADR